MQLPNAKLTWVPEFGRSHSFFTPVVDGTVTLMFCSPPSPKTDWFLSISLHQRFIHLSQQPRYRIPLRSRCLSSRCNRVDKIQCRSWWWCREGIFPSGFLWVGGCGTKKTEQLKLQTEERYFNSTGQLRNTDWSNRWNGFNTWIPSNLNSWLKILRKPDSVSNLFLWKTDMRELKLK